MLPVLARSGLLDLWKCEGGSGRLHCACGLHHTQVLYTICKYQEVLLWWSIRAVRGGKKDGGEQYKKQLGFSEIKGMEKIGYSLRLLNNTVLQENKFSHHITTSVKTLRRHFRESSLLRSNVPMWLWRVCALGTETRSLVMGHFCLHNVNLGSKSQVFT